jgi:hypothetical protein
VLMQEEIGRLRDAIEALIKRRARKRRYIRVEETLTVSEVSDLIAKPARSYRDNGKTPAKRVRAERRYGRCGETRHNSRTCKVEIEDIEDSNKSE